MPRTHRSFLAAAATLLFASPASALPLGLTLGLPDVVSGFIEVVYDAGLQSFTATGFSLEIDDDGAMPNLALDSSGAFSVIATIDNSGNFVSGTVSITGTRTPAPSFGSPLVTGTLTNFGWDGDASGIVLEFTYSTTGGSIASAGTAGGIVIATALNSFSGFGSDFDNTDEFFGGGAGTGDTAPTVPEPATALLIACGLGLALRRR